MPTRSLPFHVRLSKAQLAAIGTLHALALLAFFFPTWEGLAWLLTLHVLTAGVGISVGYHRAFAHRTLQPHPYFAPVLALIGLATWEGGPIRWAAIHRAHHRHSDRTGDPHSAEHGFWFSHMGWAFFKGPNGFRFRHLYDQVPDLAAQPALRFLDRHQLALNLLLSVLALPLLGWSVWLWAFPLRIVAVWHTTWCINSFGHRAQAGPPAPINMPWFAWLSYGEGWHRNHHLRPHAARFARIDTGYLLARSLSQVGFLSIPARAFRVRG